LTLNNPGELYADYLEKFFKDTKAQYVCGQLEKGKEGTIHLQFFANYKTQKKVGGIKKHDSRLHIEIVKINRGADNYCMKEDTRLDGPWEYGVKPVKRDSKHDWEEVKEKACKGDIDSIPADIYIKHYRNLTQIKKDHMVLKDADDLRGTWIWGPPGIGKSRKARDDNPGVIYPKLCNKWWDGYQNEDVVVMDDIGHDHKCLGQQLKIWADRYACVLETKGGAIPSNYKKFIVTSNYTIDDIWDDSAMREALHRRFKVIHMSNPLHIDYAI
jgi:hypothetical protein